MDKKHEITNEIIFKWAKYCQKKQDISACTGTHTPKYTCQHLKSMTERYKEKEQSESVQKIDERARAGARARGRAMDKRNRI